MPATLVIAGLFEILLPIVLGIWFVRRFHASWKLVGVGVLTFILSQVGHIPFLTWLTGLFQTGALPSPPAEWALIFNSVLLGLLAGLFEETARVGGYALLKQARGWKDAVAMGIGHGGIESILIGVSVLSTAGLIIATQLDIPGLDIPGLEATIAELQKTPWHIPLAGAVERISAVALHLSLSVLVLQAFIRKNAWYYAGAVLWHALIDAVAVYLNGSGWSVWALEGVVLVFGVLSVLIVLRFRDAPPAPPLPVEVETLENAQ